MISPRLAASFGLALSLSAVAPLAAEPRSTRITIWSVADRADVAAAAYVQQSFDVDVPASGQVQLTGLADAPLAWTVAATSGDAPVGALRIVSPARTASAALARGVGRAVVAVTATGEVRGILRGVDAAAIAIEVEGGGVTVLPRGEHLREVRLDGDRLAEGVGGVVLSGLPAGRRTVDLAYQVGGVSWLPSYTAVLGDGGEVEFVAQALVRNHGQAALPAGSLTLVAGAGSESTAAAQIAGPLAIGAGEQLLVDLARLAPGTRTSTRRVHEPMREGDLVDEDRRECNQLPSGDPSVGEYLAVPLPGAAQLPAASVRVVERRAGALVFVRNEALTRTVDAVLFVKGVAAGLSVRREQRECREDPRSRSLREKIQVTLVNAGDAAVDVTVREPMARSGSWKIESEDRPGRRGGPRIWEYDLRVPAKGQVQVTYTVVHSW